MCFVANFPVFDSFAFHDMIPNGGVLVWLLLAIQKLSLCRISLHTLEVLVRD